MGLTYGTKCNSAHYITYSQTDTHAALQGLHYCMVNTKTDINLLDTKAMTNFKSQIKLTVEGAGVAQ